MSTAFRFGAALVLIATLLYPQAKKSKKPKAPDAVLEKIEIKREGEIILLDGVIRNTSIKPIRGMVLHFEFFAPNKKSLAVMNGPIESAIVEPDEQAEFRLQVKAPTTAVSLVVEARDRDQKDLVIDKNGPYAIE